ncbi:MAG: DUF5666 domain-containing protein [Thermoanaerobaculia bacterium]
MKLFRSSILIPALVLLIAGPATADMRGVPASDERPQATIEGTITSVNVPIAGGGPIVTLLDGLVAFDATGATVRYVNGHAATSDTLAAGQRVLALLDPATAPLRATTVVILSDRADVTFSGKVGAVDLDAGTLTVLGFTSKVTDRTVFGGPFEGFGSKGLEDVRVGDMVFVEAKADAGALVATKVMRLGAPSDSIRRIHGIVSSIGESAWVIKLDDGSTVTVKVGPETKVTGAPKVGDAVDVLARPQSDGSLVAVAILRSVPPPAVSLERFEGVVKAIGATALTIAPKGGGPDRTFAVDGQTKIAGSPAVGDSVGVLAKKLDDGSWLAVVIAKAMLSGPARTEVEFEGVVQSISPGNPTGVWLVGETRVVVTSRTVVRGEPKVGDTVEVEGLKNPDGVVQASKIEKL